MLVTLSRRTRVTKDTVPNPWTIRTLPQEQVPKPLSPGEVEDVVRRFAHAASVCQQVGFDGVQIHSAHGYLLSSFLNPRANNRSDAYGGALENRKPRT